MSSIEAFEITLGAAFVLLDGWNRFNHPVRKDSLATYRVLQLDSRSSTTALSYYGALGLYLASLLTVFALLVQERPWVENLTETEIYARLFQGVGLPLLTALGLIVVVPQVKPFSTLERVLREKLQGWASIPVEVSRFAHDLQGYAYNPPANPSTALSGVDESPSASPAHDPADPLQPRLQVEALLHALETWKSSRHFGAYFATFSDVHRQLQTESGRLRRQVEVYQDALRELGTESKTARSQRETLKENARELLRGVCYFIAAGILRCCPLGSARDRELARLGFVPSERVEPILPGQITLILLAMTAMFVVSSLIQGRGPVDSLVLGLQIATYYVTAILAAVYLWQRLHRPASLRLRDRPYHHYLFAAGIAMGSCLSLSILFHLAPNPLEIQRILLETRGRLPYQLLTGAAAFGISFLLDNPEANGRRALKQRLLEGAALGLLLGSLAALARGMLLPIRPDLAELPASLRFVATAVSVGFVLGSCIPTWCRESRRCAPERKGREAISTATAQLPVAG